MDNVATGITGIIGGVYLIRVAAAGNAKELLKLLKDETGFIQVIIALYLIWLLHKNRSTSEFTDQLVMAAAIAALLQAASSKGNLLEELVKFGKGDQNMLEAAQHIFGFE